jgi:hypothetical protein
MYVLMFNSARQLRRKQPKIKRGFTAPRLTLLCIVGAASSLAAFVIGFVPPSQFENGSTGVYVLVIVAGTGLIGLLPAWLFLHFRKPGWKSAEPEPDIEAEEPEEAPAAAAAASSAAPPAAPEGSPASAPPEPEPAAGPPSGGAPTESDGPDPGDHHRRRIYAVVVAVLVVLVIVGLLAYSSQKNDAEAQQKAQQLEQSFKAAGLTVPASRDDIVRTLGTDGGAVCENPANALGKATLNDALTNGADFVGRRPVLVDRRIVIGEALILQTYCPDKLKAYQDTINELKLRHTVKGP